MKKKINNKLIVVPLTITIAYAFIGLYAIITSGGNCQSNTPALTSVIFIFLISILGYFYPLISGVLFILLSFLFAYAFPEAALYIKVLFTLPFFISGILFVAFKNNKQGS